MEHPIHSHNQSISGDPIIGGGHSIHNDSRADYNSSQKSIIQENKVTDVLIETNMPKMISKDMDFFVFETHIRNLLFNLIEPISKKLTENKRQIDLLRREADHSNTAIQVLETVVFKKEQDMPNIFDQIQNKIADLARESHERDEELTKKVDILQLKATRTEQDLSTLNSSHNRLDTHIRLALKDVQTLSTNVNEFRERLEQQIKDEAEINHQKFSQLKLNFKQVSDLQHELTKQTNQNSDEINRSIKVITSNSEMLESFNRKIIKLEQTKLDESTFVQLEKSIDAKIKEIKNKIDDVGNNLKKTDNYLEKYLPFNIFCQLFEVLRLVLEPSYINKVKDYEEYRIKEMYDAILSDDGVATGSFDKNYIIKPVGYDLNSMKNSGSPVKLQPKSKRFLQGRPSFIASIKSHIAHPIPDNDSPDDKSKGEHSQSRLRAPSFKNRNTRRATVIYRPSGIISNQKRVSTSTLKHSMQPSDQSYADDVDDEIQDVIDDLQTNQNDDEDSQMGIKNLAYLKKRLFGPELELIYKKFDEKILEGIQAYSRDQINYRSEIDKILREKLLIIEQFQQEIKSFDYKLQGLKNDNLQKFQVVDKKLETLTNIYNYMSLSFQNKSNAAIQQFSNSPLPTSNLLIKSRNLHRSQMEISENNQSTLHTPTPAGLRTRTSTRSIRINQGIDFVKTLSTQQKRFLIQGEKLNESIGHSSTRNDMHIYNSESRPRTAFLRHNSNTTNKKMLIVSLNNNSTTAEDQPTGEVRRSIDQTTITIQ